MLRSWAVLYHPAPFLAHAEARIPSSVSAAVTEQDKLFGVQMLISRTRKRRKIHSDGEGKS